MKVRCSYVLIFAVSAYAYKPPSFAGDVILATWEVNDKIPNIVVSPHSLLAPLGALVMGSEGTTQEQILQALNVPLLPLMSDLYMTCKQRLSELNHDMKINVSSKLYLPRSEKILSEFINFAKHMYDVDVQSVDFSNPEEIARDINNWIEKKTEKRIKKLIESSFLKPTTPAVLINTIHFDGKWRKRFDDSVPQNFYADDSNTMIVPTMTVKTKLEYGYDKEIEVEVVKVPYKDEDCFFVVLLPINTSNIDNLRVKLKKDIEVVDSALLEVTETMIELSMPVFEFEAQTDIKSVLEIINIKDIFSSNAKLTITEGASNLFIESAIQKAYIKVNEEGTQVAAAQAYDVPEFLITSHTTKKKVAIDRPFYFELRCAGMTIVNGILRKP